MRDKYKSQSPVDSTVAVWFNVLCFNWKQPAAKTAVGKAEQTANGT